jgi:hypothetical protein
MRCPDCNKFVSYGEPDPEILSSEVEDNQLTVDVRVILDCSECGTELKETTLTIEKDLTEIDDFCDCKNAEFEIVLESAILYSRSEGKGRGTKTFYGADIEVEIKCSKCGKTYIIKEAKDEQASCFEELT